MATNPTPLLSIVTITYNNLEGLQKTAQSITAQTCDNYEWIIIDGNSDDGTVQFLETVKADISISEPDHGIYDAMNKGLAQATGQYSLFLNAGDVLENQHTLQEIKERIEHKKYDFIYGDSAEEISGKITFKRSRPHTKINQGMFTHHQAMIYNISIIQKIKYDTQYKIAADYDLTWKAIKQSKEFLYLPFPMCVFEAGGVSQQQVVKGRIEQFKIRKSHGIAFIKNLSIFIAQSLVYILRRICPRLYWFLKRH